MTINSSAFERWRENEHKEMREQCPEWHDAMERMKDPKKAIQYCEMTIDDYIPHPDGEMSCGVVVGEYHSASATYIFLVKRDGERKQEVVVYEDATVYRGADALVFLKEAEQVYEEPKNNAPDYNLVSASLQEKWNYTRASIEKEEFLEEMLSSETKYSIPILEKYLSMSSANTAALIKSVLSVDSLASLRLNLRQTAQICESLGLSENLVAKAISSNGHRFEREIKEAISNVISSQPHKIEAISFIVVFKKHDHSLSVNTQKVISDGELSIYFGRNEESKPIAITGYRPISDYGDLPKHIAALRNKIDHEVLGNGEWRRRVGETEIRLDELFWAVTGREMTELDQPQELSKPWVLRR